MRLKVLVLSLMLFISVDVLADNDSYSAYKINESQAKLLMLAKDIGKRFELSETLQMILMQETLAGKLGRSGDKGKSLGVMQIQIETAKFVARVTALPALPDDHYSISLKYDDRYAMTVAAYYFKYCLSKFDNDWRKALVAYNAGITGANRMTVAQIDNHAYLKGVQNKRSAIQAFNLASR